MPGKIKTQVNKMQRLICVFTKQLPNDLSRQDKKWWTNLMNKKYMHECLLGKKCFPKLLNSL